MLIILSIPGISDWRGWVSWLLCPRRCLESFGQPEDTEMAWGVPASFYICFIILGASLPGVLLADNGRCNGCCSTLLSCSSQVKQPSVMGGAIHMALSAARRAVRLRGQARAGARVLVI